MKQYEVVVRDENSRSDTFTAKDPPDTPDAVLTNQSELARSLHGPIGARTRVLRQSGQGSQRYRQRD